MRVTTASALSFLLVTNTCGSGGKKKASVKVRELGVRVRVRVKLRITSAESP